MKEPNNSYTPPGWGIITPRMVVAGAKNLVEFIKQVFDAAGEYLTERPTVLTIGDSMIMISESRTRDATPAFLYVYVADTDKTYQRAIEAGAVSLEKPLDTPYEDRRARVDDQWGNKWQIATARI